MKETIRINGTTYRQVNEAMGLGDSQVARIYNELTKNWMLLRAAIKKTGHLGDGFFDHDDIRDVEDGLEGIEHTIRQLNKMELL